MKTMLKLFLSPVFTDAVMRGFLLSKKYVLATDVEATGDHVVNDNCCRGNSCHGNISIERRFKRRQTAADDYAQQVKFSSFRCQDHNTSAGGRHSTSQYHVHFNHTLNLFSVYNLFIKQSR